jgi:hypothetical protein
MTLRILLTCVDIVALAAVLGGFVFVITEKLRAVATNLGRIGAGVGQIATDTRILPGGSEALNHNLQVAAGNLSTAVDRAEALAR